MLGQEQHLLLLQDLRNGVVAGLPGEGFQALSRHGGHRDTAFDEGDIQRTAETPAMLAPAGRVGVDAMVDVHGTQGASEGLAQPVHGMQQDHGIEPATERHQITAGPGKLPEHFQEPVWLERRLAIRCRHRRT